VQLFWTLSDVHCDGLGIDFPGTNDGNFLQPGEFLYEQPRFEVVP
jgi:hypothetical protein